MCYGPLAIHTVCKYYFICASLHTFFVLVHNTSETTILFLGKSELKRTWFEHYFLWRKKRKRISVLFHLHCEGSSRGGCLRCLQDRLRLDQTFNIAVSPSWPVARGEEVQKRNPNKKTPPGQKSAPPDLWLTVAFFDPSRWITVTLHHESYIILNVI